MGVVLVCVFIILPIGWCVNILAVNNYHKKCKIILMVVVHIATIRPCQREYYHNRAFCLVWAVCRASVCTLSSSTASGCAGLSCCAGCCRPPPLGYMGRVGGAVVSRSISEANKKGVLLPTHPHLSCTITPTPISGSKNSAKKQKDPYKGSAFCAILALQP